MDKQSSSNVKLGMFVLGGMFVIVMSLYLIGKSQNLFGSNFMVKARFKTISGLKPGNNVRFSGIDAGTVKEIKILNDTCIEVSMVLDKKLKSFIHKNSIADIGSEGLMGNKVIDVTPDNAPASEIEDGDLLQTKEEINTGSMLETFSHTNDNVQVISGDLKLALRRLNESKPLWSLLEDSTLATDIKDILRNFKKSSVDFNASMADLHDMLAGVKRGEGVAGVLVADKKEADEMKKTLDNLNGISGNINRLTVRLDSIAAGIEGDLKHGHGTIPTLLKDPGAADKLNNSLQNIEQASETLKQEMDALKQNRFIKKYMKKSELQKAGQGK